MRAKLLKYLNCALSIAFVIAAGFFRDFLFVNLNYRLSSLYYKHFKYELPSSLRFLKGFDYMELYYLKYVFTGLSFLVFMLGSLWVVYAFFREKKYLRWVLISYLIVILAGVVTFAGLYFIADVNTTYTFTRHVIDIAESPVMTIILLIVILLSRKIKTEEKPAL